jgi:hypothetical protein
MCAETIGSSPLWLDVSSELEKNGCRLGPVAAISKALVVWDGSTAQLCLVQCCWVVFWYNAARVRRLITF